MAATSSSSIFQIGKWRSEGKQLGSGSFATVYLGYEYDEETGSKGKQVAIKVMNLSNLLKQAGSEEAKTAGYKRLVDELRHQYKCNSSAYTVGLLDVLLLDDLLYLILELCWGDLAKLMALRGGHFEEPEIKRFARHLALGLQDLAAHKIIHRDLKPQNLLVTFPGTTPSDWEDPAFLPSPLKAVLKISDFGFARVLEEGTVAQTLCGSPLYMAPEILLDQAYTQKADMYSCGAILFQLVFVRPPYVCQNFLQIYKTHIENKAVPVPIPTDSGAVVSPSCVALISGLLAKSPDSRLSISEFLNHPWFAEEEEGPLHDDSDSEEKKRAAASSATSLSEIDALKAFIQIQQDRILELEEQVSQTRKNCVVLKDLQIDDLVMLYHQPNLGYKVFGAHHNLTHVLSPESREAFQSQIDKKSLIFGRVIETKKNSSHVEVTITAVKTPNL